MPFRPNREDRKISIARFWPFAWIRILHSRFTSWKIRALIRKARLARLAMAHCLTMLEAKLTMDAYYAKYYAE